MRIVFFPYHGYGHLHPALALVNVLRGHGHTVAVAGAAFFQGYVTRLGYAYHPLKSVPFGMGFENWVSQIRKSKFPYWTSLHARITDGLYADREKELVQVLDIFQPDAVVLDGTQSTDFIVLYPHLRSRGIRVAILHAMFPTHILPGRPPANSDALPNDEAAMTQALKVLQHQQRKKAQRQKLMYFGFDDRHLVVRRLRRNAVPAKYISPLPDLLNFSIDRVPQFICAPREFDFPGFQPPASHHYVGFPHWTRSDNGSQDYAEKMAVVLRKKQTRQARLLYCAFGTLEADTKARVITILTRLADALQQTSHIMVLATKLKAELPAFGEHIHTFDFVPQADVLRHADLFISHGGFNSVAESIVAGVPLLVYPVHDDFDPRGNAARVAYHGMGLRGSADETAAEMLQKINELLNNDVYRQRIRDMQQKNQAYTDAFINTFQPVLVD